MLAFSCRPVLAAERRGGLCSTEWRRRMQADAVARVRFGLAVPDRVRPKHRGPKRPPASVEARNNRHFARAERKRSMLLAQRIRPNETKRAAMWARNAAPGHAGSALSAAIPGFHRHNRLRRTSPRCQSLARTRRNNAPARCAQIILLDGSFARQYHASTGFSPGGMTPHRVA